MADYLPGELPFEVKDYTNSVPLNWHLWSEEMTVIDSVKGFCLCLIAPESKLDTCIYMKNLSAAVHVLFLNLYRAWLVDPNMYVGVSLNKNKYSSPKMVQTSKKGKSRKQRKTSFSNPRYNPYGITYEAIDQALKVLCEYGYIEWKKGVHYKNAKYQSRIKATPKLIQFFAYRGFTEALVLGTMPNEELIELRGTKPKGTKTKSPKLDYRDDDFPKVRKWREDLRAYNLLLAKTYLDVNFDLSMLNNHAPILLGNRLVKRIFNDGSFARGGRYYGGFWQGMPSEYRPYIMINGSFTCELDYNGLHIALLYALEGTSLSDLPEDIYQLPGYDSGDKKLRHLIKRLMLIAINASGKRSVLKALQDEIKDHPQDFPDVIPDLNELYEALLRKHQPIAHYFSSGVGIKLQYLDSLIATEVINQAVAGGEPILCVHDSFICRVGYQDKLKKLMEDAFIKVLIRERPELKEVLTNETPKIKGKSYRTRINDLVAVVPQPQEYFIKSNPVNSSKAPNTSNLKSLGGVVLSLILPSVEARLDRWRREGYLHYNTRLDQH